ncbi:MAG: hypothetical protein H7246_11110 [Phycisphaerae bacterium]|nr:hypothetical protein [Saprospiraceae bacterium]
MKKKDMLIELNASPLNLSLLERDQFKVTISATNHGASIADPELHLAELYVNDIPSKPWSLAIGNGKREAKWTALPSGETISMTWATLGEALFPEPGEYILILKHKSTTLPPIKVQILTK